MPPPTLPPFLERRFAWLAAALLAWQGVAMVSSALGETQTYDEGIHAAIGYSYWVTGDLQRDPGHPALGKLLLTLPLTVLRPELNTSSEAFRNENVEQIGIEFLYENRLAPETILLACRAVNIGITLLLGVYLAWWTRRRCGAPAALLALAFFAFDPNLTAHGRYVTTDMLAAAPVFLTVTLWIEYLITRRRAWLVLAGLALGVAFTSKLSTLFLAAVLPGLFWLWPRRAAGWRGAREWAAACLALALLSGAVIAAVYAPQILHPDPATYLRDRLTGTGAAGGTLLWLAQRIPVRPIAWFVGIDRLSEINAAGRPQYLLGQFSNHGWWYYFPVTFAVKTPVGVLAALALAGALAFRLRDALRPHWRLLLALLLPAAAYFALSMAAGLNIGHRHLLPVYPLLYVALGCVLTAAAREPAGVKWTGAALAAVAAAESAAIYPDYLAFFNFAAGGPAAGPRYVLDSNLDWGQAFAAVGRYARREGIARVCLFSFGNGAAHRYVPGASQLDPAKLDQMDCVAAVSATPLYGLYVGAEVLAPLRQRKPLAVIGHSVYLYDLRRTRGPD